MPRPVIYTEETNEYFSLKITKPSLRYVDFLKLKSAPDLIRTGFYPNSKEISETQGVFEAARHKLKLDYQDNSIAIVVVGDGYNPRTGYYIATMTKWNVFSVDPEMKRDLEKIKSFINTKNNLFIYPYKIEECKIDLKQFNTIVLLFVHSHASLIESVKAIEYHSDAKIHAVSMPCCFDDDLGIPIDIEFDDPYVISVHRKMQIYCDIKKHLI